MPRTTADLLDELFAFIRIPSISSGDGAPEDLRRAAVWVGDRVRDAGGTAEVLDTAKKFMTQDEWDYWMEGKPAKSDIVSPTGEKIESAGAVRDGGSFNERMGHVSVWNTVMDEDRYMVRKWNEFIAA